MPENNTVATSAPETDRRASVGEIAAFVAEANRLIGLRDVSARDRLAYFEWKVDLFARLTRDDGDASVVEARAEAARLRAELTGEAA
ncbi:MAG TPA: hypothetical protein VGL93_07670 [Streptosporangiaceae bacterium]|jgi:hypothetical protein